MSKFWEALGDRAGDRWLSTRITAAFLFWSGGLAIWLLSHGSAAADLSRWVSDRPAAVQVALLAGVGLLLDASSMLVGRLAVPGLRLLEGYWPIGSRTFAKRSRNRLSARADEWRSELDSLWRKETLSSAEDQQHQRLEMRLRRVPEERSRMPTRLGNVLRAAEDLPRQKYGLDPVICWPALWLLLDDGSRAELSEARERLDRAVMAWIWSAGFALWTFGVVWTSWGWLAIPLALVATIASNHAALDAAAPYADLLEACFDIYRRRLYDALRWPMPESPAEERTFGEDITEYLDRGSDASKPRFT